MKNLSKLILVFVVLTSLFVSCNSNKSLEVFIVDQQEKSDVFSVDVQPSMLLVSDKIQDEKDKAIINSLKKVILVGYKVTAETKDRYLSDLKQVREILKQDKYEEFIRVGKGSQGVKIYVVGKDEKVDEVIILGNDSEKGWGLVRVLGKNMDPGKMLEVVKKLDLNEKDFDFSMFENLDLD